MAWIIVDLDDTLLITSAIYQKARLEFAQLIEELKLGNSAETINLLNEIDWINRKKLDVAKERLAISMYDTYCELVKRAATDPDLSIREKCFDIMQKVFTHRYRLVWAARKVLTECKNMGHRMVLYTRGDRELQERKIKDAKLEEFFEHICIVPHKNEAQLLNILLELAIEPEDAWMIGDEVLTDVLPGLNLGMNVIRVWGYHEYEPAALPKSDRLYNVKSLVHILPILEKLDFSTNQDQITKITRQIPTYNKY